MNIESVTFLGAQAQARPSAGEKVTQERKEAKDKALVGAEDKKREKNLAKEELLQQIKALTEDGLYSVRFEKHKSTDELVIKLVDEKGETIRQIPAEEIIELSKRLQDLRGNVVKTES